MNEKKTKIIMVIIYDIDISVATRLVEKFLFLDMYDKHWISLRGH